MYKKVVLTSVRLLLEAPVGSGLGQMLPGLYIKVGGQFHPAHK